jgi:hypothetical protein
MRNCNVYSLKTDHSEFKTENLRKLSYSNPKSLVKNQLIVDKSRIIIDSKFSIFINENTTNHIGLL